MIATPFKRFICILFTLYFLSFVTLAFAEDGRKTVDKQGEKNSSRIDEEEFKQLEERTRELEERLRELESKAVLSEPELIVKEKDVWICDNGHEYDERHNGKCPLDGLSLHKSFTYQREKVFRRQTISEKIEEVLEEEAKKGITIGISGTGTIQHANRLEGAGNEADGDLFGIGSLDIFFIAKPVLYTMFFADIEAIGGFSPDDQISNISGLNSDSARLEDDREVNVREAWLRAELFDQKLALSAGMLDLTNYFDSNMAANDETTQFITDTLVNNPFLAPPTNGGGVAAVFDPKTGIKLRAGIQRGENSKKSMSEKTYSIFELEYLSHLGTLPEGHYRLWYRLNEDTNLENMAWGISADQKLIPAIMLFARFGHQFTSDSFNDNDYFYSGGIQFNSPYTFSPGDVWAIGFQLTDLASGVEESIVEGYYNLFLTDNLKTSFHLQYLMDSNVGGIDKSYLLPGIRVQFDF